MTGSVKLNLPSGGSVTLSAADSTSNYTVNLPPTAGTLNAWTNVSGSTALSSGNTYMITSATAATLTLPASPATGATINIADANTITGSVVHTLARNGSTIYSLAENLTLDIPNFQITLWYSGSTWTLI